MMHMMHVRLSRSNLASLPCLQLHRFLRERCPHNRLTEDQARWLFQQLIVGLDHCHRMVRCCVVVSPKQLCVLWVCVLHMPQLAGVTASMPGSQERCQVHVRHTRCLVRGSSFNGLCSSRPGRTG